MLVHVVNAFVDGPEGGNPAGVVIDANGLSKSQKQQLARELGLSEISFVSASRVATFKLDFFTPTRQIAHCGHATIATFHLLRQLGLVDDGLLSKETIDGTRRIRVDGGMAFMEQSAPSYHRIEEDSELGQEILASLALPRDRLAEGPGPFVVDTGGAFLVLPLVDERSVARIQPDLERIEAISNDLDLVGFYPFSRETRTSGRHAAARMFAPRFGIPEEAATGMAAGSLACFLHEHLGVEDGRIVIEQGSLMEPPSPSVLTVDLEVTGGEISCLMAGGTARIVSSVRLAAESEGPPEVSA